MQWSADEYAGFSITNSWRAPGNDYEQVNVALQSGDSNSLLEHYRTLISLRNSHSSLRTGEVVLLDTNNSGVYAALRVDDNETLLVLVNLTDGRSQITRSHLRTQIWQDQLTVLKLYLGLGRLTAAS